MKRLALTTPKAVIHKVWPKETQSSTQKKKASPQAELPPSLPELASSAGSVPELLRKLTPIPPEKVGFIERETVGQHINEKWVQQRQGRLTASGFHGVYTRMKTVETQPDASCDNLLARVLGYDKPPENLPALKYGRDAEKPAKLKFAEVMRENGHKDVIIQEVGLFVLDTHPYIGASPDAVVQCSCCGFACLEVKCPISCSGKAPGPDNVEYLEGGGNGDPVKLRKSHAYFSQVQGELAVTHLSKCYFFVYIQGMDIVLLRWNWT